MNKIYCKNCVFSLKCLGNYSCKFGVECDVMGFIKKNLKENDYNEYEQIEMNKNFNCEHYKRKWYKFWIKEK